jgi:DNA-binding LytR/AlgR family response regulator
MILRLLKKPYPFIFNTNSVLVPSAVTFILILVLKPLGFSEIELIERLVIALVISTIIGVSIILGVRLLKKFAPNYMNEDGWTVGKEMSLFLFVLLIITISITLVLLTMNLIQNGAVLTTRKALKLFLNTAYITFGLSILPVLVIILFEQHNHQKKQYQKAQHLSNLLQNQLKTIASKGNKEDKLIFSSDKNDIALQVDASDVIFIQSDGNYVEINYINQDKLQKKLIRNRIKAIEEQLPQAIFFRCHNRYMVNTKRITNVTGNARGLYLNLENTKAVIPVSRSKVKAFHAIFKK